MLTNIRESSNCISDAWHAIVKDGQIKINQVTITLGIQYNIRCLNIPTKSIRSVIISCHTKFEVPVHNSAAVQVL